MKISLELSFYFLVITTSLFAQNNSEKRFIDKSENHTKFKVVLDPGHGGKDSVTRIDGILEKNLVLEIAKAIKSELLNKGFEVIMTRETDQFVSLTERALVTGDVFISLHANAVADSIGPSVRSMIQGTEIYYSKSMRYNPALFKRTMLLADAFSKTLSKIDGITLRGVKEKSLAVLNNNPSPAILIELGYLSNPDDLAFLFDKSNHPKIALAVAKGLMNYKTLIENR